MDCIVIILPLLGGWILDYFFGDPVGLPHPVVGFGRVISFFESRLNQGSCRVVKGGALSVLLILSTFFMTVGLLRLLPEMLRVIVETIGVFYCLAGTTLIREVKAVSTSLDESLEKGRCQVARIVGRDTQNLSEQEVRTAALETLAENLSDGVVAPLFWYALLGLPGMMAYKMVNTLDSMIGYRNERYLKFGRVAAKIDDVANYVPARLCAMLMIMVSGKIEHFKMVFKYGPEHASPNSGWPEASLASILNCRFGGTHNYFGEEVEKPYIGDNPRLLVPADTAVGVRINRLVEIFMLIITVIIRLAIDN